MFRKFILEAIETIHLKITSTFKFFLYIVHPPANKYLPKKNNRNRRNRCEQCANSTRNAPERPHRHCSGIFFVNFEHILYPVEI